MPVNKPVVYIATPYSHPEEAVRERRYDEACEALAALAHKYIVYSAIAQWAPVALMYDLPTDAMFWKEQNEAMIDHCDEIIVVQFDGWDTSKGVKMEIDYAYTKNKPLSYLHPSTFRSEEETPIGD